MDAVAENLAQFADRLNQSICSRTKAVLAVPANMNPCAATVAWCRVALRGSRASFMPRSKTESALDWRCKKLSWRSTMKPEARSTRRRRPSRTVYSGSAASPVATGSAATASPSFVAAREGGLSSLSSARIKGWWSDSAMSNPS